MWRVVLRVIFALALIGFVTLSTVHLLGLSLFKPPSTVGQRSIDRLTMPVLIL